MNIQISDIKWDTDGEDPKALGLPLELVIDAAAEGITDPADQVADWLSDRYGWCVETFSHSPAVVDEVPAAPPGLG